jgi:hypothetical protein
MKDFFRNQYEFNVDWRKITISPLLFVRFVLTARGFDQPLNGWDIMKGK